MNMNWTGIGKLVIQGAIFAGGAFISTLQTGASPKQAGLGAVIALLGTVIGLLQQKVEVVQ